MERGGESAGIGNEIVICAFGTLNRPARGNKVLSPSRQNSSTRCRCRVFASYGKRRDSLTKRTLPPAAALGEGEAIKPRGCGHVQPTFINDHPAYLCVAGRRELRFGANFLIARQPASRGLRARDERTYLYSIA